MNIVKPTRAVCMQFGRWSFPPVNVIQDLWTFWLPSFVSLIDSILQSWHCAQHTEWNNNKREDQSLSEIKLSASPLWLNLIYPTQWYYNASILHNTSLSCKLQGDIVVRIECGHWSLWFCYVLGLGFIQFNTTHTTYDVWYGRVTWTNGLIQ